MPDDSTIRMRRMRAHRNGYHPMCSEASCEAKSELATRARQTINARAILDYCRFNGVDRDELGDELPELRRIAQWHFEVEYPEMAEDFKVDITEMYQARFTVEEMIGRMINHPTNLGPY